MSADEFPTIADEWQEFRTKILEPAGVKPGSAQFIETRRAFYAGAATMFTMMCKVSADDISEAQGELYFARLRGELDGWVRALKVGAV